MVIYTIGHSNHPLRHFLDLLFSAQIVEVIDVRSVPRSRRFPHFNKALLATALTQQGVTYTFTGDCLGGRPTDATLLKDGSADYDRMARSSAFLGCVDEVRKKARRRRLALLCSEHEPLECHRCLLIARYLAADGVAVGHILRTGVVEPHKATEDRLMALHKLAGGDLLAPRPERLAQAYRAQEDRLFGRAPASRARKTAR